MFLSNATLKDNFEQQIANTGSATAELIAVDYTGESDTITLKSSDYAEQIDQIVEFFQEYYGAGFVSDWEIDAHGTRVFWTETAAQLTYLVSYNETCFGAECGLIQAEKIADAIADSVYLHFPGIESVSIQSSFSNETDSKLDYNSTKGISESEIEKIEQLQTKINEWIDQNWIEIINAQSDSLFKSVFEAVFQAVEFEQRDRWFDYYTEQTRNKVTAQNKMQGWDSGVRYYFTDSPDLPESLIEQYFTDRGLNVIVGCSGEWDNLPSCASEAEIREFLGQFYGDLPDSEGWE